MKQKRMNVIFAIVVGFLMVTSVIGLVFVGYSNSGESLDYNGYSFERQPDGSLLMYYEGNPSVFVYFPTELENIQMADGIAASVKASKMLYVTSDFFSNNSQLIGTAEYNLGVALNDLFSVYAVQGFFQNASALPVVTCRNATSFVPVISFQEGNQTRIFKDGECIIVESDKPDGFIMARDRFVYGLMGVMDG